MDLKSFLLIHVLPFLAGGLCWHLFMHWLIRDRK